MKELNFLDYCTEYSCKGSINKEMRKEACFGYVFRNVKDNYSVKYNIILYSGIDFSAKGHRSNACIFTKKEVRNHLKLLKSIYPIHFSVRDYKGKDDYSKFVVSITIEKAPATFHKYALTWIRYLYEFPYNMLLKDAYTLKKEPTFRFESIANLFNLTLGCYCYEPREIHQIPRNAISNRLRLADIKKRITQVKELNNIYQGAHAKKNVIPKKIQDFSVHDIEYWENGFEERKPIYIKTYRR